MTENASDVVIVGGGIAGLTTAYYLAKARVPSVVVERDAIGSHASGFAYGGLSPLSGFGIPGPLAEIAQDGMRLHRELRESVVEETGIDVDFRVRCSLALAFSEADVQRLQAALPWQQRQPGYAARWLDASEARRVEPRVSDETLGATLIEGTAGVEPYRLVLALTRAAEGLGVRVRHGRAISLLRDSGRVTGVVLERDVVACSTVVLALGPWSAEVSDWIGVPIDVRPLKGQILRLQAPGPPIDCSVGWGHNYATTKTDGLLWAGTTEEEAGFDEDSTAAARDEIGAALVKMLPAMADAQIAHQTACLRPVASDGLLVLGRVPGLEHVYVATGGARKGILYGPAMGRSIADLILGRDTRVALEAFAPGRFVRDRAFLATHAGPRGRG
jgi:glycine oxidase